MRPFIHDRRFLLALTRRGMFQQRTVLPWLKSSFSSIVDPNARKIDFERWRPGDPVPRWELSEQSPEPSVVSSEAGTPGDEASPSAIDWEGLVAFASVLAVLLSVIVFLVSDPAKPADSDASKKPDDSKAQADAPVSPGIIWSFVPGYILDASKQLPDDAQKWVESVAGPRPS